jgi:hypothetical protein
LIARKYKYVDTDTSPSLASQIEKPYLPDEPQKKGRKKEKKRKIPLMAPGEKKTPVRMESDHSLEESPDIHNIPRNSDSRRYVQSDTTCLGYAVMALPDKYP